MNRDTVSQLNGDERPSLASKVKRDNRLNFKFPHIKGELFVSYFNYQWHLYNNDKSILIPIPMPDMGKWKIVNDDGNDIQLQEIHQILECNTINIKVDKFEDADNWIHWVGFNVSKRSNKPFKSGKHIGLVKEYTINPNSGKNAFKMDDDSIVDCYQVKLV